MRLFLSAGEPSGDLHGSNLIRSFRALHPDAEFIGFGGERMAAAGCRMIESLCGWSLSWFKAYGRYFQLKRLVDQAAVLFRRRHVHAVVLIDFPGFNWHLARRARKFGVPVHYFVPPQLWAWGDWRLRKLRRDVNHVLCTLPFEYEWYRRRGIRAKYVGHPYFDALHQRELDAEFIADQRRRPRRVVAILPGSRRVEIEYNLATLVKAAQIVHQAHRDVRFLVAALDHEFERTIRSRIDGSNLPIEVHSGRTGEILEVAELCMAVSGSVSLELLHHCVPSVITYRVHKLGWLLGRLLMKVPWITLVNLLAQKTVFPEYLTCRCESASIGAQISDWLRRPEASAAIRVELGRLRNRFAIPGACDAAAQHLARSIRGHADDVSLRRMAVEVPDLQRDAAHPISREYRAFPQTGTTMR